MKKILFKTFRPKFWHLREREGNLWLSLDPCEMKWSRVAKPSVLRMSTKSCLPFTMSYRFNTGTLQLPCWYLHVLKHGFIPNNAYCNLILILFLKIYKMALKYVTITINKENCYMSFKLMWTSIWLQNISHYGSALKILCSKLPGNPSSGVAVGVDYVTNLIDRFMFSRFYFNFRTCSVEFGFYYSFYKCERFFIVNTKIYICFYSCLLFPLFLYR